MIFFFHTQCQGGYVQVQAEHGDLKKDATGKWNYFSLREARLEQAAAEAVNNRRDKVLTFWYAGTPAPVMFGDTAESLVARYNKWRVAIQSGDSFLVLSTILSDSGVRNNPYNTFLAKLPLEAEIKTPQQ